jgi:uncharacterized protein
MELAPTAAGEREEFLDVLRGVALLGIVSANMISYSLYLYLPEAARTGMRTWAADKRLDFLELFLIEGKFYTIFSVLFGVGFAILLSRAGTKELTFHRFFLRRVFFLFLFGAAHALLFWHNDILMAYAICGAVLLAFVSATNRTILIGAAVALVAPLAIEFAGGMPVGFIHGMRDALFDRFGFSRDTMVATWTTGSRGSIVRLNLAKWFDQAEFLIRTGMIFKIFGCFLLGFCLGRNGIHRKLERYRPLLRRLAAWGFAIGLPLNLGFAASYDSGSWLEGVTATFGILPLSVAYTSRVCLGWLGARGRERLLIFAPVGRMALTNYVGQSIICTLVFYGTGLGLGGRVGPTVYLPIGFAVYGMQVVASRWWLNRCRFGPLEWLWRMLTYGQWLPLGKRAETSTQRVA